MFLNFSVASKDAVVEFNSAGDIWWADLIPV
jgi:hypothetical protein